MQNWILISNFNWTFSKFCLLIYIYIYILNYWLIWVLLLISTTISINRIFEIFHRQRESVMILAKSYNTASLYSVKKTKAKIKILKYFMFVICISKTKTKTKQNLAINHLLFFWIISNHSFTNISLSWNISQKKKKKKIIVKHTHQL